ncbi:MAG TPA: NDP-sugar synthase [Vicinamibacterales bacterium]|nr:NDP-sugar synthase [Vicinamibacterales bacterium]
MRALVLAAGLGTRLQPLTLVRAKAAAPVDGEPLVCRTIRWLVSHGITDLVVNLHHKPETIAAAVGDGSDLGARVRYSWESPVLGSAGGPRHALPLLLDDGGSPTPRTGERGTCVLVNGDTLTTVDLPAMIDQHRRSGADVTMALIPNPRPDKYGGVVVDERGAVTGFTRRGGGGLHFVGPQVIEAGAFLPLEDGVPSETVLDLYPKLIAARRGSVMGFVSDATFHDIGTPADLLETSLALAAADGRVDRPRWGRGVRVAASARVSRSVLWDNVTVEDGAAVDECVVADNVTIAAGARYHRSAIVRTGDTLVVQPLA